MERSITFEAIVVGIINLLMFIITNALFTNLNVFLKIFLTGVFVHIFFEFSPFGNLNEKWCRATFSTPS